MEEEPKYCSGLQAQKISTPQAAETGRDIGQLRARLGDLRGEFEEKTPKALDKMGLTDEPVPPWLLEKLPVSRQERLKVIPQDVRQEIDGKQAGNQLEPVLELVDAMSL